MSTKLRTSGPNEWNENTSFTSCNNLEVAGSFGDSKAALVNGLENALARKFGGGVSLRSQHDARVAICRGLKKHAKTSYNETLYVRGIGWPL